ncbi:MAG: CHRD domain-containing protein [Actinobacteria bacterium]|nr:CHRD domain-containing protein [Actinomycetota bacterium]
MHRRSAAVLLATIAVTIIAFAPPAQAVQRFTTTLTGANEIPGPGDPDGSGTATITINRGLGEVCWEIEVTDITLPAIGAHIHLAPVTAAGPVVVPLTPPDSTGTSSGCTTVDRELAKAIAKDPGAYYVNVHTTDYPAGALRGQLN